MDITKPRRLVFLSLGLFLLGACSLLQKSPTVEGPPPTKEDLIRYLEGNWMTPEDYVVTKFLDHDIVIIGEHHHIKHDIEFIQGLIPVLYRSGIFNIGIEFGAYEYQDQADALVTGEVYDEDLARWLMFHWASFWPYVEYMDLYRKAWELNKSLPPEAQKFRIVSLDYRARYDLLTEDMPFERWKDILHKGTRDEHMARVVRKEFLRKNKKALLYVGQHHAFTRYHLPRYSFEVNEIIEHNERSMGNLLYRWIRKKAFNICLHYPWMTVNGRKTYDYPADGAIDEALRGFSTKRVGFDTGGSPFGLLRDQGAVYAAGSKDFTLNGFCDGYIFLKPFGEYEGCTVDPLFITEENLVEAVAFLPNAEIKKKIRTPAQFLAKMRWDADFRRLYPDLK